MAPSSLPHPPKRRKILMSPDDDDALIQDLEARLTTAVAAKKSLNPLVDLLDVALSASSPARVHKAVYSLYRVFVVVIGSGLLDAQEEERARVVRAWIQERLSSFTSFLVGLLKDAEPTLQASALRILMSLLKHMSTSLSKSSAHPQFHVPFFKKIIEALLAAPPSQRTESKSEDDGRLDDNVRDLFAKTWLNVYDDVRWFFLRDCSPVSEQLAMQKHPRAYENLLALLESLQRFPRTQSDINTWWVEEVGIKPPRFKNSGVFSSASDDDEPASDLEDDWRKFFDEPSEKDAGRGKKAAPSARLNQMTVHQSLHALTSHRAVFTRAWLGLLPHLSDPRRLDSSLALRALNVMHQGVMPHLTRAIMVMDWVGSCVDYGGVVGLLALNTLFILIQDYNLDYPVFYTRLYAFLDRDLLHLKHRARFFRLAELFLSSTHLPATLLASFVKRLSRLTLNASPSGIVMTIPFVYNILKRHPALMVMIHRDSDELGDPSHDPFLADEPNPNATQALESSLWELCSMRRHYHSGVSTLARIFEEAFTKPAYPLEDFLDHTYSTLLDTEFKRKIKKDPAVADELPRALFNISDAAPTATSDPVAELWSFSC
ncbi:CBF-domain-containing protein [Vararia minispora EC-137]|uniref:CBF-domain-containing protein n=1 Tax=Vararia minispora EC-137 TaxID=1314806 RepID=A0ACB8QJR2_9AGAM|nr:CBF-domain-containing protein [Vararia minispora EC-137]